MPTWLKLALALLGLSLVVPVFVLGMSSGNWRMAGRAWWQYARLMLLLAVPGAIGWLWFLVFPPNP